MLCVVCWLICWLHVEESGAAACGLVLFHHVAQQQLNPGLGRRPAPVGFEYACSTVLYVLCCAVCTICVCVCPRRIVKWGSHPMCVSWAADMQQAALNHQLWSTNSCLGTVHGVDLQGCICGELHPQVFRVGLLLLLL
jgi:hypothetical protein